MITKQQLFDQFKEVMIGYYEHDESIDQIYEATTSQELVDIAIEKGDAEAVLTTLLALLTRFRNIKVISNVRPLIYS